MNTGNEKVKIITAIITQLLVLVNLGLSAAGKSPLPITSEAAAVIVSAGLAAAVSTWNLWKNRNVTTAAQKGQEITDALKSGALLFSEVEELLNKKLKEGE